MGERERTGEPGRERERERKRERERERESERMGFHEGAGGREWNADLQSETE